MLPPRDCAAAWRESHLRPEARAGLCGRSKQDAQTDWPPEARLRDDICLGKWADASSIRTSLCDL